MSWYHRLKWVVCSLFGLQLETQKWIEPCIACTQVVRWPVAGDSPQTLLAIMKNYLIKGFEHKSQVQQIK